MPNFELARLLRKVRCPVRQEHLQRRAVCAFKQKLCALDVGHPDHSQRNRIIKTDTIGTQQGLSQFKPLLALLL